MDDPIGMPPRDSAMSPHQGVFQGGVPYQGGHQGTSMVLGGNDMPVRMAVDARHVGAIIGQGCLTISDISKVGD